MKAKTMLTVFLSAVLAFFTFTALPHAPNSTAEAADDVIKWKAPCHWPASSVSFKDSLQAVADRVEERTDGKLVIEPHEAGSLIPGDQVFSAVKRGMYPIGITSSAYDLDQVPILNVVAGPPLNFKSVWEAAYYHKWMGFEQLVKDVFEENHGMLYFSDKVYPTELSLKKPVRSFEDFDGLKIRSSGILQKYLTSIGASAEYIPGGDIYAALSSGVAEGAHWGAVQGSSSMNFYEVNKYHLRPALNFAATDIWLINKEAFEELPSDVQDVLVDTLNEQFWLRTNQYKYLEEVELARIQQEEDVELIELPPEEYQKMQGEAVKMWDDIAEKSSECAEAIDMLKEFNRKMGRLE
ncbi:MAG: TRAP transporter substrate-binding protein DctP [Desulfosalsimonas sp.]